MERPFSEKIYWK